MRPPNSLPPLVRIANGTFYRHHPSDISSHGSNPPLFPSLTFALPSQTSSPQHWCIVGPSLSGKTTLLQILGGQHLCLPPSARSFPYLSTDAVPHRLRSAARAIRYVGFDAEQRGGGSGLGPAASAYLSARYESRREVTDFSLRDFLLGHTQLNAAETGAAAADDGAVSAELLGRVVRDLRLEPLLDLPVAFLSNGQGRRARIARALLTGPEALLLDEPFMGLDPLAVASLSPLLRSLAERAQPRLVLSARPQDAIPEWVTHLMYLRTDCDVGAMGEKQVVLKGLGLYAQGVRNGSLQEDVKMPVHAVSEVGRVLTEKGIEGESLGEMLGGASPAIRSTGGGNAKGTNTKMDKTKHGEALVEMDGCRVRYGDKVVLGNWTEERVDSHGRTREVEGLTWTVRRGERWSVLGPNGSGKTTIVSLLCSDHPQAYSLPLKLFGRSRLPEPGTGQSPLTFWDIQSRVGHSSPEIHQHMPRNLTVRQVIESAWADTFRSKPRLDDDARSKVDACLRWFGPELDPRRRSDGASSGSARDDVAWARQYLFGELSFSAQRVLLLLRALVKGPDIVVLDEAFSGMDDAVRDKCALFLEHGEEKAFLPSRIALQGRQGATARLDGDHTAVETAAPESHNIAVRGLTDRQALICISHIKEEVPDCVREWLCLPESSTQQPARFGRLDGPLRLDSRRWNEIWGM